MRVTKYILICFMIIAAGCRSRSKPIFEPFIVKGNNAYSFKSENKILKYKSEYFFVTNFSETEECEKQIDSFAHTFDSEASKYYSYDIHLYKVSKTTNALNLKDNPDLLNTYSNIHDKIYMYYWMNGKFSQRYKIRNGKLVDPNYEFNFTEPQ